MATRVRLIIDRAVENLTSWNGVCQSAVCTLSIAVKINSNEISMKSLMRPFQKKYASSLCLAHASFPEFRLISHTGT